MTADETFTAFRFVSEGTKGRIEKFVVFQWAGVPDLYNLAFGDVDALTGKLNDTVVTDNGDTEKVLATVVEAIYQFVWRRPNAMIYATGSTPARTRLYRIGISKFYERVREDFILFGRIGDALHDFQIGQVYDGFLAIRKFS